MMMMMMIIIIDQNIPWQGPLLTSLFSCLYREFCPPNSIAKFMQSMEILNLSTQNIEDESCHDLYWEKREVLTAERIDDRGHLQPTIQHNRAKTCPCPGLTSRCPRYSHSKQVGRCPLTGHQGLFSISILHYSSQSHPLLPSSPLNPLPAQAIHFPLSIYSSLASDPIFSG